MIEREELMRIAAEKGVAIVIDETWNDASPWPETLAIHAPRPVDATSMFEQRRKIATAPTISRRERARRKKRRKAGKTYRRQCRQRKGKR